MDQVHGDVDRHVAALGLGADQFDLVPVAVDRRHPRAVVSHLAASNEPRAASATASLASPAECRPAGCDSAASAE